MKSILSAQKPQVFRLLGGESCIERIVFPRTVSLNLGLTELLLVKTVFHLRRQKSHQDRQILLGQGLSQLPLRQRWRTTSRNLG